MLFKYHGVDSKGKEKKGSVDASGAKEARVRLRAEGIYVTSIKEERVASGRGEGDFPLFQKSVPPKEMASFLRQLASLLSAGIPLMETLDATQKQSGSEFLKKVINELKDGVRQGAPLASSMEKHSTIFDKLTVATVRAGEAGGNLAHVLTKIADYKETNLRRENSLKSATVYPVTMAVIGSGVIIFLVAYIVPKISVIFEDMEAALPLSTQILMVITNIVLNYGYGLMIFLCVALLGVARYVKTKEGKRVLDKFLINAWILGPVVRASILARWSHTTSVLLTSGVPLLQTLMLSKEVTDNTIYAEALEKASDIIREGGAIAPSLERSKLFPPVALQMIAAGEKSGQSATLLEQVARDQGEELENRIAILMSLVQPILISVLGLAVGFIVMAILLPIFEISQLIG
ncbi:MAG: type II secretion system F family protein [Nitrospinota bacterium]|nr:type II secretion system F family protein [Nitrospinota bacterium]